MTASSPVTGKFSAAKTALILLSLSGVWVVFISLPAHKEVSHKISVPKSAVETKLHAVGLPDNPDLDSLPEIFSIWSSKAEWKEGKTRFAYWHPTMKTYAYFFQATQIGGQVRFKEISEPHDPSYHWDDSLSDDCPIRFYTSTRETGSVERTDMPAISVPLFTNPGQAGVDVPASKVLNPEPPPVTVYTQSERNSDSP